MSDKRKTIGIDLGIRWYEKPEPTEIEKVIAKKKLGWRLSHPPQ